MSKQKHLERVAVCSWSLQPESPAVLADCLDQIGINRVQLALDPIRENPAGWGDAFEVVTSLNSGTDYSCADYVAGSYNDWRVANINELRSLVNQNYGIPAISNTQGDAKWSEGDPFVNLRIGRI